MDEGAKLKFGSKQELTRVSMSLLEMLNLSDVPIASDGFNLLICMLGGHRHNGLHVHFIHH